MTGFLNKSKENCRILSENEVVEGFDKMKKEILPTFHEDKCKFESTGIMPSYYASVFFQSEAALKKPELNPCLEIKLDAMVDEVHLRESLVKACKVCPYVTYSIEIRKDSVPPVYFKKTNTDIQPFEMNTIKEFGTAENDGHYVIVSYRDDTIRVQVSHLLTDGHGIHFFAGVLLNIYLGKTQDIPYISEEDDYVADLMARKLPLSDGYESKNYCVKDRFLIPEAEGVSGTSFIQSFCVDFDQVKNFCKRNSISMQVCTTLFMALAIMKVNPENEKVISIRGAVDTRKILGVPNTFQNASAPHLFFNVDANKIKEGAISEICTSLMTDMKSQLTYDNVADFTNRLAQFNFVNDADEKKQIVISYKSQTDIFANYLGELLPSVESEHVLSVSNKLGASYPLMLYTTKIGDKAKFLFVSTFEADSYVEAMKTVLSDNQIQ